MGDVEDLIRWSTEFKMQLRSSGPMGALPDTAQKQFDKFMVSYISVTCCLSSEYSKIINMHFL